MDFVTSLNQFKGDDVSKVTLNAYKDTYEFLDCSLKHFGHFLHVLFQTALIVWV